jgi:hypothetical protein
LEESSLPIDLGTEPPTDQDRGVTNWLRYMNGHVFLFGPEDFNGGDIEKFRNRAHSAASRNGKHAKTMKVIRDGVEHLRVRFV